jgi:hypothetical protein
VLYDPYLIYRLSIDYVNTSGPYSCGHSKSEMSHDHRFNSQWLQNGLKFITDTMHKSLVSTPF